MSGVVCLQPWALQSQKSAPCSKLEGPYLLQWVSGSRGSTWLACAQSIFSSDHFLYCIAAERGQTQKVSSHNKWQHFQFPHWNHSYSIWTNLIKWAERLALIDRTKGIMCKAWTFSGRGVAGEDFSLHRDSDLKMRWHELTTSTSSHFLIWWWILFVSGNMCFLWWDLTPPLEQHLTREAATSTCYGRGTITY